MAVIGQVAEWMKAWAIPLLAGGAIVSIAGLWGAAWLIARLPEDFFLHNHRKEMRQSHFAIWLAWAIAKNVLGVIVLLLGLIMSVAPGPGLLTILIGLSMCDFPGKKALLQGILRRRPVQKSLNWIRRRAQRPPLKFPERPAPASSTAKT